jgi:hypothetical protein
MSKVTQQSALGTYASGRSGVTSAESAVGSAMRIPCSALGMRGPTCGPKG